MEVEDEEETQSDYSRHVTTPNNQPKPSTYPPIRRRRRGEEGGDAFTHTQTEKKGVITVFTLSGDE